MATVARQHGDRGVAVGRVLDRAFSTIRNHPLATLTIAILFTGLPTAAAEYLLARLPWDIMVMTVGSFALPGTFALLIAKWFVSLALGVIVQGAMTVPAVAVSEGRRAGFGEVLGAALRVLVPLVLMGVLFAVSVIIGTSLLIVPGLIIYLFWAVAPAAEAHERDGVFLALSRSQELSEGARWKVFGILAILLGISLVAAVLTGFLTFLMFRMEWIGGSLVTINLVARGVLGAIVDVIWGAALASLYVELKEWKEGGSVEALEQVFV